MTATCFNSSLLHYYLQITVGDTQYLTKKTKVVHFIKKNTPSKISDRVFTSLDTFFDKKILSDYLLLSNKTHF